MKLEPGKYFGNAVRQINIEGLLLTLSQYVPNQAQPRHVHANPTLYVLVAGDKREQSRRADFEQRPLVGVFHPTSEPHASLVGPRGSFGVNLEFNGDWLERQELRERDLRAYRVLDFVWTRLAALQLLLLSAQSSDHAAAGLETVALEMLAFVVQSEFPCERLTYPRWLRRAEEFIHDGFRAPMRLRTVARDAGVHPVHLARVFRRRHCCSVTEYIGALRLAEAGQLILGQSSSISQAAHSAGFADHAHLCRCFSRRFGFSPTALRSASAWHLSRV
jgi:AraC family transcriptional regulator